MSTFEEALAATKTPEEVAALRTQVKQRLQDLDTEWAGREFDPNAREEFGMLRDLASVAQTRELEFRTRRSAVMEVAVGGDGTIEAGSDRPRTRVKSNLPENLFDLQEYRNRTSSEEGMKALLKDGAKKAADAAIYPHERANADNTVGVIHRLLDNAEDVSAVARQILGTGSAEYGRAFGKMLAGQPLSSSEMAAINVVGTTTAGGFAVPFTIDPTIIRTSDVGVNPLRQISRVEQITGNTWKGLTTGGITLTRGQAESSPVTPSSVTLGQPEATVNDIRGEIQFSIEAGEDWQGLAGEMAAVLQDAKDAEEADAFINDTGASTHAEGLVFGMNASSEVGTGGDGFSLDDLNRLMGRLPDRYEPRAKFLAHRAVYAEIERLDRASGGAVLYRGLNSGESASLLGYPRYNSSGMESDFTDNGETIMVFGDFQNFLIVDRIGLSIEVDPHVRDGDGKWTGQRAFLAHYRNTSKILVDNAFRVLVVGTVAS